MASGSPQAIQKTREKSRLAAAQAPRGFVDFQHPKLVEKPPTGPDWLHEIKFDGYRMQLQVRAGRATFYSRNGNDWTDRFKHLAAVASELEDCILDAELCAVGDEGYSNFSKLRSAIFKAPDNLVLFAFDILWRGDQDVRARPIEDRKAMLRELLDEAGEDVAEAIRYVDEVPGEGAPLLSAACQLRWEGIVSKRRGSPYRSGVRGDAWVKSKCRPSESIVVGGYVTKNGRFQYLLGGVREPDGRLRYVGSIKQGYPAPVLQDLLPRLKPLATDQNPFTGAPRKTSDIHWLRPELVAEVEMAELTGSGMLRQSSFKGLRDDAAPADRPEPPLARRTRIAAKLTGLTHADKALWPETDGRPAISKQDLARYYEAAAPWLLPYLRGRPCTVLLATEGIEGELFFQRHEGQRRGGLRDAPSVTHVAVPATGHVFPQFDTVEALQAAAQSGAVELHPWNCVEGDPDLPGRFGFDHDPDEGLAFEAVVQAAKEVRDRLSDVGLPAFLKTSGNKGLHVVTPFLQDPARPVTWAEAKAFAKHLCGEMAADSPDLYTIALPKAACRGRVFLDYLRTDQTRHAASLLSPRANAAATVSMPLSWRLARAGLDARAYTMATALQAMKAEDPWGDWQAQATPLRSAIARQRRSANT